MIWLARKAFFGRVPCPAMHVDTGKKFPEMYAFRDRYAKEWQLDLLVEPCPPIDAIDPTLPPAARSAARKTEGLKLALAKHGFDGLVAGIRRDEEADPRQGARVLAARRRRPVGCARPAARVLEPLQRFAAAGRASARASDPALDRRRHLGLHASAKAFRSSRFIWRATASATARSAMPTSPFRSNRTPAPSMRSSPSWTATKIPERAGRAMDHESEDAFERLRKAGYL